MPDKKDALQQFITLDMQRRTGTAPFRTPEEAALQDRLNEGQLIGEMIPDILHPVALPIFGAAAGGFEGVKALGQKTGLGRFLPGPFKHTPGVSSDASLDNVLLALEGFRRGSDLFQKGGQVPKGKGGYRKGGKVKKRKFQTGGIPTVKQLPAGQQQGQVGGPGGVVGQAVTAAGDINPNTSQLEGAAQQLQGFDPGIAAQTQPLEQTAQQLQGFNPLGGAAGNTLQGFIQTGNAVDVDPITQAAQIRARQGFDDFLNQSRESFGALGLGSSSAARAAEAREAGRLQGQVAARGLEAGVGAQEAARQRQLQAFNPLLGGSGQQLAGLQGAGQLRGQAAGLGLQGQIAQGQQRLGALQGAGQLFGQASGQQLQGQLGQAGAFGGLASTLVPPTVQTNQQPGLGGGGFGPQRRGPGLGRRIGFTPFQRGGRVDLGDFLGELTFGRRFFRSDPQPQQQAPDLPRAVRRISRQGRNRPFVHDPATRRAQPRAASPQDLMELLGRAGQQSVGGRALTRGDNQALGRLAMFLGPNNVAANMRNAGQGFASMANTAANVAGGLQQQQLANRGQMDRINAMISAGIPLRQEGGVIPGPSVPPDVVPILAQGGEGIVTVDEMHELEQANTPAELAAIGARIKQTMEQNPHPSDKKRQRDIQRKQRGGKISKVMGEFKRGTLKSSDGSPVTDRKQAIAIALSEARDAGEQVPEKRTGGIVKSEADKFRTGGIVKAEADKMRTGGIVRAEADKMRTGGIASAPADKKQHGGVVDPFADRPDLQTTEEALSRTDLGGDDVLTALARILGTRAFFSPETGRVEATAGLLGGGTERGELLRQRTAESPEVEQPDALRQAFLSSQQTVEPISSGRQPALRSVDLPAPTEAPRAPLTATTPDGRTFSSDNTRGTVSELGGELDFPGKGQLPDPLEEAQRALQDAQRVTSGLRSAMVLGNQGSLERLAPMLGRAQQQEALAAQNLQALAEQRQREQQAQLESLTALMGLQQEAQQSALDRASQERRTQTSSDATVEAARIRSQGPDLSALAGEAEVAIPPEAQDLVSQIKTIDFTNVERTPENTQQALEFVGQLADIGLDEQTIRSLVPELVAFAGLQ